ncbi:uncharacterized protein TNCV_1640301 [Trichonephila clavipes]|nr:uncharacterized protein TNCV_1640301 [Trichonephila clavipes]
MVMLLNLWLSCHVSSIPNTTEDHSPFFIDGLMHVNYVEVPNLPVDGEIVWRVDSNSGVALGRRKAEAIRASAPLGAPSRSRFILNRIRTRKISKVECYFCLYSPKNWEFWTKCQLATCDDHRPCIDLGLPPYTIINHSVKRRQSVKPICAIHHWYQGSRPGGSLAHGFTRQDQTLLARFRSGHIKTMKFSEGRKSFEMCTNCSSEPATPAHILEYLGLTKQDLADVPLLVLNFLKM